MTLRLRLLLVSMATLAVGLTAVLVVGNILLDRTVAGVTTQLLRSRAETQLATITVTAAGVHVRDVANDGALDGNAWILSGQRVIDQPARASAALDAAAIALGRRARPRAVERQGPADVQLLSRPLTAPGSSRVIGSVVVGVSDSPFDSLRHKVLLGSLATAALILVAGAVATQRALLGALRPVRLMTVNAEDWGAHDLDRRFDLGAPRDELTGLAMTLDRLLERIAASRRHEQRFAGDVAHELRTPLSVIRGHAELALDARVAESETELRAALTAIATQAVLMGATVDGLLAVAQSEMDPQAGTVDLRAVAREFDGVEVRVLGTAPLAEGDPEIVRRAFAPLVDNAIQHARRRVIIELSLVGERARALIRDDGDGFDAELGEAAFDPGRRGPQEPDGGAGLGLALARRLARACGGEVTIGPGPGGCVILELPARTEA